MPRGARRTGSYPETAAVRCEDREDLRPVGYNPELDQLVGRVCDVRPSVRRTRGTLLPRQMACYPHHRYHDTYRPHRGVHLSGCSRLESEHHLTLFANHSHRYGGG